MKRINREKITAACVATSITILLFLGLSYRVSASIALKENISFSIDDTTYRLGRTCTITNNITLQNSLYLDNNRWKIKPSAGELTIYLNDYSTQYHNFTESTSVNAYIEHNFTALNPLQTYSVYKEGVVVDTVTSDAEGEIWYNASAFLGSKEFVFAEGELGSTYYCNSSYPNKIFDYSFNTSTYQSVDVYFNNTPAGSRFYCIMRNLAGECNYGATNASIVGFNVSDTNLASCNVSVWGTNSLTGNITVSLSEDESYSKENLNINTSVIHYIKHYCEWGYES